MRVVFNYFVVLRFITFYFVFFEFFLHASEQYLISSQFFSQDLRHVIVLAQTKQALLGRYFLLPLNSFSIKPPKVEHSFKRI